MKSNCFLVKFHSILAYLIHYLKSIVSVLAILSPVSARFSPLVGGRRDFILESLASDAL